MPLIDKLNIKKTKNIFRINFKNIKYVLNLNYIFGYNIDFLYNFKYEINFIFNKKKSNFFLIYTK